MPIKCGKCSKQISREEDFTSCTKHCGSSYHVICAGFDDDTFQDIKNNQSKLRSWGCKFCRVNIFSNIKSKALPLPTSMTVDSIEIEAMSLEL